MMTKKHVHYHVHYHYLNRNPPSPENTIYCKDSYEPAAFTYEIPERAVECPTSFIPWHPELPRYVDQNLMDCKLDGETVLWSGKPNAAALRKSFLQRGIGFVISLMSTFLYLTMFLMGLEQADGLFLLIPVVFFLCFDFGMFVHLNEISFYKRDYYVITPTRVLFFHGTYFHGTCSGALHLKDIDSWKVDFAENSVGTLFLDNAFSSDLHLTHWTLYKIDTFQYVKHLLLSLLAKTSAIKVETTPDIPRLVYCPHCGYNLQKVEKF